jgi:hypothetical protein
LFKSILSIWQKMALALAIIFWLNVDYCFTIMSYDGLVYYLIFEWWLKPSVLFNRTYFIHMTTSVSHRLNIKSSSVLSSNSVHSVICPWWHFTHMCNTLSWPHHFNKRGWAHKTTLPHHYSLQCLYQYRKVGSHIYNNRC